MKNFGLIVFYLGAIISCTSMIKKEFYFNEIIIQNNSSEIVRGVLIKVEKTGQIFKCSIIAPHGECSNSFKKKIYQGNLASISWSNRNSVISTEEVKLPVPINFNPDKLIKGILEINSDGSINPYLQQ